MKCPECLEPLVLAKTVQLRSGRVLRILECRKCGHTQVDTLEASA